VAVQWRDAPTVWQGAGATLPAAWGLPGSLRVVVSLVNTESGLSDVAPIDQEGRVEYLGKGISPVIPYPRAGSNAC